MHDILVPSFDSLASVALDYAAGLARRFAAGITGMYVYEPIGNVVAGTSPAVASVVVAFARERMARSREAAVTFERWAAGAGVARSNWLSALGPIPETVAFAANWHDLMVMERNDADPWGTVNSVGRLVLDAQLPVIVLPHGYSQSADVGTIAIAWNGSPESTRALHGALPLLKLANRVIVLRGERRVPFFSITEPPAFDPVAYLEQHGLQPQLRLLACDDDFIGAEILDHASTLQSDLVVMGGYGRNRFSEWVLGGATRHALRESQIPVLFRH